MDDFAKEIKTSIVDLKPSMVEPANLKWSTEDPLAKMDERVV